MSAPHQGRQSPEPEKQSKSQVGTQGSGNANDQGAARSKDHAGDESERQKTDSLSSNPGGVLDKVADDKTAKGQGNEALGGK